MATTTRDSAAPIFEFTKRKRWADILITELADTIIYALSPDGNILFCSSAVTELLGWRDTELVNKPFEDFVFSEDWVNFRTSFERGQEFLLYCRLKTKEPIYPNEVLFEIKARPSTRSSCFFAMARPYPSRNTAALNTFLSLKIENWRLQQKLHDLSGRPTFPKLRVDEPQTMGNRFALGGAHSLFTPSSLIPGYDDSQSPMRSTFDTGAVFGTAPTADHDDEDGGRKKKVKKTHTTDQHVCVTCGRTDSPEWRKGPLGPKTLCNACGLRWAKSQRKTDVPDGGGGGGGIDTT
ncbi:hypothetical protein CYLTODRAFT_419169 [Cylindrobasidium torrendii FP15055 ss-10]|uniref:GATA-domain-containing protein n=1 Tax=Cylindrobasidium torrendii FP15055 ss-10 TaxID=1314674 RepID=A0A0D7BLK5_9AGAR|nr:hypothetical protein CYLTODRAFT_419169 [Cylindrobasidium torrendii FP15055 ss-10]